MRVKSDWNKLMNLLKFNKHAKIRPDNLALLSTSKIFKGNAHKAESYLMREGMDAVGLKLYLLPENIKKVVEMIDSSFDISRKSNKKQMKHIESILFDFIFSRSSSDTGAYIKKYLEDFAKMAITVYKFAESNERSVESTFFVYIIANPNYSVVKDIVNLIGMLVMYLPLLYLAFMLRLNKNIKTMKDYFRSEPKNKKIQIMLEFLLPVLLNFIFILSLKHFLNQIFISQDYSNQLICADPNFYNYSFIPFPQDSFLNQIITTSTDLDLIPSWLLKNIALVKLCLFSCTFILLLCICKLIKKSLNTSFTSKIHQCSNLSIIKKNIEKMFSKLMLVTFIAIKGIYK